MTKIVLDANTLVAQHFLKGHLGIALVFASRRMGASIVIPEGTLKEAKFHTARLAAERRRDIEAAADQLQVILGGRPAVGWPGDQAIESAIENHLEAIKDIVSLVPIDVDLARAGLTRLIERRPPSHNKEEFRDALLWETVLRLARDDRIYFVTEDFDFLVAKESKRALHPDLAAEIGRLGTPFEHHLTLSSLLDALGPDVKQPDRKAVSDTLADALLPMVQQELVSRGITLQDVRESNWKVFATQDPNRLAVSFQTPFVASSTSAASTSPVAATVIASGSAGLDPRTNQLMNVDLDGIEVSYEDGGRGGIKYMRASDSSSGSTWRTYEFRQPL